MFNSLKKHLEVATLPNIDVNFPFMMEYDALDVISAYLEGRQKTCSIYVSNPVRELHYSAVEKETTIIIEAVRMRSHFLALIRVQCSGSFLHALQSEKI